MKHGAPQSIESSTSPARRRKAIYRMSIAKIWV
jgi:hypothetical protein